jgi:collagenase-like PrtC family protease
MSILDKQCEIIVPCSHIDQLPCVLNMDVDALYFGIRGWSRSNRELELSIFQVEEFCRKSHGKGKRVLLSFNLMPSPMEAEQAWITLEEVLPKGIDGVICSDPSLAMRIRDSFPHIEVHASLGTLILSLEEAHFWGDIGVKRVVLSPHLTLEEIQELSFSLSSRGIETEMMLFGVRCRATLLGICRMSSYFDMNLENSGLRTVIWSGSSKRSGVCYRTCAQEWKEASGKEWLWSPQVYWDIEKLPSLLQAGVKAFKIGSRGMDWKRLSTLVKALRGKMREEESYV